MTMTLTAFQRAPDGGRGLARDMRVRWALEEVGQPYEVRLLPFAALKQPDHLVLHPFGQIPTLQEGDVTLFETGAIILHVATHYPGLLPDGRAARARAIAWMFAALNTLEPPMLELQAARLLEADRPWAEARLPLVLERVRVRLRQFADHLAGATWLDGAFSAGDLLMVSVLRWMKTPGVLEEFPTLAAYVARGEARPAFVRAFAAQRAVHDAAPPG